MKDELAKCGCGGEAHLYQRDWEAGGKLKKLNEWRVCCSRCRIMTLYFRHKEQATGTWNKAMSVQSGS